MSKFFPVQKSILSCDAIAERVLSQYEIDQNFICRFISHGLNDTYRVICKDKTYYLRIYRINWRTKDDILSEITLLNHLNENKLPVSFPIKKSNGEYLTEINAIEGKRYAVLFTSAIGKQNFKLNNKRSYNYGKIAASFHIESDKLKKLDRFHIDLKHLLDDPFVYIKPFLSDREKDLNYLKGVADTLRKKIKILLSKKKPIYGICHGDFHNANIFFDKEENVSVFDFDCFGYGWRAYDISVYLWTIGLNKGMKQKDKGKITRLWNSFLKGYNEVRKLSKEELEAVFIFVPIRHIWLLGLHTHGCNDWGGNWITDAYFTREIKFIKDWIERYKLL